MTAIKLRDSFKEKFFCRNYELDPYIPDEGYNEDQILNMKKIFNKSRRYYT